MYRTCFLGKKLLKRTMMNREIKPLTRAELEIMQILWKKGAAFVNDIREEMPEPRPAYNTVSTIVRILEKKGVVGYEAVGKSHRYYPLVGKEEYTQGFMRSVLGNFFDHSPARLVSFFCDREDLSLQEAEQILSIARDTIARKKE